ncbi:flagellar filament capping protein FliD [Jonesia quinghaiensis]|uniref:flagellar filament capping protein FliD n=1 Tax=Jonesia quinghaiensis TaxID=262806 RepID=UPI00040BA94C|nr:flagellar filament capping protein FliD [Jonesia quinghaiensis]
MSMSIGGLASGLDTTGIIDNLMKIEAIPQTQLQSKQKTTNSFITALQALNTKVASLTENAAKAMKAASFDVWKGNASADSVTVATATGATAGSIEFRVDALAQGRSSLSGVLADASTLLTDGKFTITDGKGVSHEITPSSTSLTDLASAINAKSDLGVKATLVNTAGGSRLQLSSTATGATEGSYTVTSGSAEGDFSQIRAAQDAQITLWPDLALPGSAVTSASNTFDDLMAGVDVTVTKVSAPTDAAITVDVVKDDDAITKLGENLVAQLNLILSEISSQSKVTTSTSSTGTATAKGGVFTGDSGVRQLASQISEAASFPVDGKSPASIGITLNRDGTFAFDAAKFKTAFTDDPSATQAMLTGVATRIEAAGKATSHKDEGTLTRRIQGQQSLAADYTKQIERWDDRLEQRRANLVQVYTALEVALSGIQSQSTWLSGQLASLPSWDS